MHFPTKQGTNNAKRPFLKKSCLTRFPSSACFSVALPLDNKSLYSCTTRIINCNLGFIVSLKRSTNHVVRRLRQKDAQTDLGSAGTCYSIFVLFRCSCIQIDSFLSIKKVPDNLTSFMSVIDCFCLSFWKCNFY